MKFNISVVEKTKVMKTLNERLTAMNREIFNRAAEAKKFHLVQRFFTRRGLVFIQRDEKSRPMCIYHISDMDAVFPPNYDRRQNASRLRNIGQPFKERAPAKSPASSTPPPMAFVQQQPTLPLDGSTKGNEQMNVDPPNSEQQTINDIGTCNPVVKLVILCTIKLSYAK